MIFNHTKIETNTFYESNNSKIIKNNSTIMLHFFEKNVKSLLCYIGFAITELVVGS